MVVATDTFNVTIIILHITFYRFISLTSLKVFFETLPIQLNSTIDLRKNKN